MVRSVLPKIVVFYAEIKDVRFWMSQELSKKVSRNVLKTENFFVIIYLLYEIFAQKKG